MRYQFVPVAILIAVLISGPAHAGIIYDNGASLLQGGATSTSAIPLADDFVLAEGQSTITDIHWSGFYLELAKIIPDASIDNFTIFIYGDAGGTPGAAPLHTLTGAIERTDTGNDNSLGADEVDYVLNIDPLELLAGTTYWISIVNDPQFIADKSKGVVPIAPAWFWSYSALDGDAHQKLPAAWTNIDAELAFQLTNDAVVPEPASLTLLGIGLVAVAARKRFARNR